MSMKYYILIALIFTVTSVTAQRNYRDYLRGGNKFYTDSLFEKSEVQYRKALEKDADKIGIADNFFTALGGTSLDYFTLLNLVKNRFNIEIPSDEGNRLTTVKEFCDYIGKH